MIVSKVTKDQSFTLSLEDTLKTTGRGGQIDCPPPPAVKGKFHHWQRLELCKVVHNAKLH